MKGWTLVPNGAPVSLGEWPPGMFEFDGTLALKSEYKTRSLSQPSVWQSDAYIIESGEYFWGGTSDPKKRELLTVQPLTASPSPQSNNGGARPEG